MRKKKPNRWLTNIFRSEAWGLLPMDLEEFARLERYLEDKVVGPPAGSAVYTAVELEAMGMVGIYRKGATNGDGR